MARCRIVGLVAMEIHPEAACRRDLTERAHRLRAFGCRLLEVGDAANHLDAHVEGACQVLHIAGPAQITVLREGDKLDVEALLHRLLDVKERFHADQRGVGDVDMGADREQALRDRPGAIFECPLDVPLEGQLRPQLTPKGDPLEQRSALVVTRIAIGERGVHVEMSVDEGRRDQLSGRVDFCRGRGIQLRLDRRDHAVAHPYIDACTTVRQRRAAHNQIHPSPSRSGWPCGWIAAPKLDDPSRIRCPRSLRNPVPRITQSSAVCREFDSHLGRSTQQRCWNANEMFCRH